MEKWMGFLLYEPHLNLKPRCVPWVRIKPKTLWHTLNQLSHPGQGNCSSVMTSM